LVTATVIVAPAVTVVPLFAPFTVIDGEDGGGTVT
jgi:hypothetical protein